MEDMKNLKRKMIVKFLSSTINTPTFDDWSRILCNGSKPSIQDSFNQLCRRVCDSHDYGYKLTFEPSCDELDQYAFYADYWMLKAVNDLRIPNRWKYKMLAFPKDEKSIIIGLGNYMKEAELDFFDIQNEAFHFDDIHADINTQRIFNDYQLFRNHQSIIGGDCFFESSVLHMKLTNAYIHLSESYSPTLSDSELDYLMLFITDEAAEKYIGKYAIGKLVASVYLYALSEFGEFLLPFINENGVVNELQYDILRYIVEVMDLELQGYDFSLSDLVDILFSGRAKSSTIDDLSVLPMEGYKVVEKKAQKLYKIVDRYMTNHDDDNYKYIAYLNVGEIVDRRMKIGFDDSSVLKLERF